MKKVLITVILATMVVLGTNTHSFSGALDKTPTAPNFVIENVKLFDRVLQDSSNFCVYR
jgi:hypothetical protein